MTDRVDERLLVAELAAARAGAEQFWMVVLALATLGVSSVGGAVALVSATCGDSEASGCFPQLGWVVIPTVPYAVTAYSSNKPPFGLSHVHPRPTLRRPRVVWVSVFPYLVLLFVDVGVVAIAFGHSPSSSSGVGSQEPAAARPQWSSATAPSPLR